MGIVKVNDFELKRNRFICRLKTVSFLLEIQAEELEQLDLLAIQMIVCTIVSSSLEIVLACSLFSSHNLPKQRTEYRCFTIVTKNHSYYHNEI